MAALQKVNSIYSYRVLSHRSRKNCKELGYDFDGINVPTNATIIPACLRPVCSAAGKSSTGAAGHPFSTV